LLRNDPAHPGTFRGDRFDQTPGLSLDVGVHVPGFVTSDFNNDGAMDLAITGSSLASLGGVRDRFEIGIRTLKQMVTAVNRPIGPFDFGLRRLPDANGNGVPDAIELLAPHGGDGDGDGRLDFEQPNIASLPNAG